MAALLDVDAVLQWLDYEESSDKGEDIQSYLPSAPEDFDRPCNGGVASASEIDGKERPSDDNTPPGPATGPLQDR